MNKNCKISIVTVTFNSAGTLRRTFESVRTQKYQNIEYIVIDGGSTDGTQHLIDEYCFLINKLIVEPDRGIADAFNKGIKCASGDLVGFLNSDDVLFSEYSLDKIAQNYRDQRTIICGAIQFVENQNVRVLYSKPDRLGDGMYIRHPATYIPADLIKLNGWFDEKYKIAMDYDYLLRMNKRCPSYVVIKDVVTKMYAGGASSNSAAAAVEEFEIKFKYKGLRAKDVFYFLAHYSFAIIKKLAQGSKRKNDLR